MRTTTENKESNVTESNAAHHAASLDNSAHDAKDATALLQADHTLVNDLFTDYESAHSATQKKGLVDKICLKLSVHAQIEEEIFYPAVKQALKDSKEDSKLVPEALVEHATLKALIAEVEGVEPGDEMFDAKIKVLSEYVKHHVREEEDEIFPKIKVTSLDMYELGAQLAERKAELTAEHGKPKN